MNEVLHANIFFVIASIGFVVLTIIVSIILFQVLKIVTSIRRIIDRIEMSSELLAEDVADLRAFVRRGGFVSQLFSFIMPKGARRAKRAAKEDTTD
jgi:hypothetical protein